MISISESLKRIKSYTEDNNDLKHCHHFLFNAIYKRENRINNLNSRADVIVMSINPAETKKDYEYKGPTPTENSNERDFHEHLSPENIRQ